jgi:hypothetical protein
MYEKNGKRISEAQASYAANQKGYSLEEWASSNGWTITEGKQNDSTETDPPANQKTETPAGDSSLGGISLGSPEVDPYLLSEEELEGSEEDVYTKISAKLRAVGIKTDQFLPGYNAIELTTADGRRTSIMWATAKTAKERAAKLNKFVAANADTSYADNVGAGKENIISDYYKATDIKEPSIKEAKDNFVDTRIANWKRREKRDTGMGTSMRVDLLEDDFDDAAEYELYKSWKETGVVKVDENAISSHQKDMAFEAKNRQSEKFIDNLSGEDREAVRAVLANDMVQKQYRFNNIDQEVREANNLWVETKSMIDTWNEKGGGNAEERAEIQRRIVTAASLNEDINSFVEDIADSQDLTMAVQNFNKNYSLLSKLSVGFEEVGLNIAYGASQLAAYAAGSNNGGGIVMGGIYADLVTEAFKPVLEDVAKERQQFATGPSLSQMDGSFDDVVDWVGNTAVQAVPSLSLAFTGPAAMPLFFMSGYGGAASEFALNEYRALDRMAENRKLLESGVELSEEDIARINAEMEEDSKTVNIEDWRKVGYATLAGAAEVAFEAVGTLNILKGASKAVNPTTLRAAGTKFLKAANQEGMSEAATEITNNVGRNIFFGEDINIFEGATEGAIEAYAGGALVGGPLSLKGSAPIVYEYAVSTLMDSRTRKDIQKKLKQLEELTGFKNLDNVLKGAANRPQRFSPEVEKLVNEINEEIDLLKDGVANRLGTDISNAQAYKIASVTMEMRQTNDRFRKLAESGVEGAELQAAEKTLRAKFDKLAAERELLLADNSGTKEAKEYNDKLKVSMDAKAGYEVMLGRQYIRKRADYAQAFAAQNQSTINDYLAKAKEELGENATAEDIRFKANENYFVEKTKKEIAQNKESAANFARANGLDITFIEADKNNIAQIAKEYGGSVDADAFIFADGKTIVVNTDVAAINGRAGVWSHEVLHALVMNKLGSNANANKAGEELLNWLEKNSPDVYAYVTARLGTSYEGNDAYFEEAMNALSDYIAEGNEVNISTLGQLRMFVSKLFGEGKGSIELDNGEQTFAFIATYANKNKNSKTVELIRSFGKAARKDDEKKGKSKASMSSSAERAKQVLEKVSSNMDFFDPNSPLIARVLPGMIQAQLSKLSNKGLQFDMEEAISDIIYRLYSNGDINKFDGRGALYGYVNGRISFRIKDMLKASGEGKNDIVEDFNQSDVEDLKGVAADVTTIEQIEERTEAERPEYRPLLNSRIATPELIETY